MASSRQILVDKIREIHGQDDSKHFQQVLENKYASLQSYKDYLESIKADLAARGEVFPTTIVDVPMVSSEISEHWVDCWQLGFSDSAGFRGKPKQVSIVELAINFVEKSFQSVRQPLNVTFTSPNGPVGMFSMKHTVGFTRSLASKMVLEFWPELDQSQQRDLLDVFKSCVAIKVTWESATNAESEFFASVRGKFQLSESTRPDVIQLYHGWQALFAKMGVDFSAAISDQIKKFNQSSSVAGSRVSEQEAQILKILPFQLKSFVDLLEAHWDRHKSPESAVTLKSLCEKLGPDRKSLPTDNAVWGSIFKPSPEKNFIWLQRQLEMFAQNQRQMIGNTKKKQGSMAFRAAPCH